MTKGLEDLLAAAKNAPFTPQDEEEQRKSFAYGNTNIENSRVTRDTIEKEAKSLKAEKDASR